MAVCHACDQEMTLGLPCTEDEYVIGGEICPRIPYSADRERECHDCAVPPGAFHHPGCDDERCPVHPGRQSISCGCG